MEKKMKKKKEGGRRKIRLKWEKKEIDKNTDDGMSEVNKENKKSKKKE